MNLMISLVKKGLLNMYVQCVTKTSTLDVILLMDAISKALVFVKF
jgi:hypothetical protein